MRKKSGPNNVTMKSGVLKALWENILKHDEQFRVLWKKLWAMKSVNNGEGL